MTAREGLGFAAVLAAIILSWPALLAAHELGRGRGTQEDGRKVLGFVAIAVVSAALLWPLLTGGG